MFVVKKCVPGYFQKDFSWIDETVEKEIQRNTKDIHIVVGGGREFS